MGYSPCGRKELHMTEQKQIFSRDSCAFLIELYSLTTPPPKPLQVKIWDLIPRRQPSSGGCRILGHQRGQSLNKGAERPPKPVVFLAPWVEAPVMLDSECPPAGVVFSRSPWLERGAHHSH